MSDTVSFVSATPVLPAADIRRAVDFYVSHFGFQALHVAQGEYGVVVRDNVGLHFWACDDRAILAASGCRLQVEGIGTLYEQCVAAGLTHPKSPLADKPWGTREFGIVDCEGNLVTFVQRKPH